jgi:pyridoxamine 5'-phosphate oxidase
MDIKDCIKFASENPICCIATEDGDQPRVRTFMMWFADESGLYFHTGFPKNVYKQLNSNPKVEICFNTPKFDRMMRLTGVVEFLDDAALRTRLLEEKPFLKAFTKGPYNPMLAIFRVSRGEAWFWTMADNLKESEVPRIRF